MPLKPNPLLVFVLAAALIIFGRIPVIIAPPWDIDEGVYAAVGQALNRGELLYQDVWDNKPPGIYFLFNWVEHVSADPTYFRLLATLFLVVTAGVVYYLARRTLSAYKANWSLAVFSFLAIVPILETHISNAEIFFVLPTTLAILLTVLIEFFKMNRRYYVVIGALLAIGFLFKSVVGFDALAILIFLAFRYGWGVKERLRLVLGGALLILLIPAIYLLTNGLASDFIKAAFLNNFGYVRDGNGLIISFIDVANPWITVTGKILLLAGVIWAIARHYRKKMTAVTLYYLWLALTIFGSLLSGRPYLHYLIAAMPAMSLLIPEFWAQVWPPAKLRLISRTGYWKGLAVVAVVILALIFGFWGKVQLLVSTPEFARAARGYYANAYSYLTGQISQDEFYRFFGEVVNLNLKLQQYLSSHTRPTDRLYIWGNAPWVYYLSGLPHASKYLVVYQLTFVKEAPAEVLAELQKDPPEFIIVTNEPVFISQAGSPTPKFPEFERFLNANYRIKDRVGSADIFEKVNLADAGTP